MTVGKTGYYKAFRVFSVTNNNTNFIKLKLIPRTLSGNIDALAGCSVTLGDNSKIIVPAGSVVVRSTKQHYTGSIKVFAAPIDPTVADIGSQYREASRGMIMKTTGCC